MKEPKRYDFRQDDYTLHHIKHNEQINKQNIDNFECVGVKFVKIYPEMTSQ
jgi:hypothetical protein